MQKIEKIEKIEEFEEIPEKKDILKRLKAGKVIHGKDIEKIRKVKTRRTTIQKICEWLRDIITIESAEHFFYQLPALPFSEEQKKILIDLLGEEEYGCDLLKINELFQNDNKFDKGNDFAKKRSLKQFVENLDFSFELDIDGKKKNIKTTTAASHKKETLAFILSNDVDYLLKVIYIILITKINGIDFYFAYTYCFHGLLDNSYNIGESEFRKEYYLNRYFGHTLFLRSPKKKSTCRSRELLEKNRDDHTFQILEIKKGYFGNKSEIKDLIRLSEEHFFNEYRKKGCFLVNVKDSGAAVLKKKKIKNVQRKDCEICGKKDVDQSKSGLKSHNKSKKHQEALEEEVVDLDTEDI